MISIKEENMGNQSIGKRRMEKISQELAGAWHPRVAVVSSGSVTWYIPITPSASFKSSY
jgi:hypothetical protein